MVHRIPQQIIELFLLRRKADLQIFHIIIGMAQAKHVHRHPLCTLVLILLHDPVDIHHNKLWCLVF